MKTTGVEYRRTVSDGNFGNWRYGLSGEVEEGETHQEAEDKIQRQVNEWVTRDKEREQAEKEAERERGRPWRATPAMVGDQPTLRERALAAGRLEAEHERTKRAEWAHKQALEVFGRDLVFVRQDDGSVIAEDEGVTWIFGGGDFTLLVPVGSAGERRKLTYFSSLAELGQRWAQAENRYAEEQEARVAAARRQAEAQAAEGGQAATAAGDEATQGDAGYGLTELNGGTLGAQAADEDDYNEDDDEL